MGIRSARRSASSTRLRTSVGDVAPVGRRAGDDRRAQARARLATRARRVVEVGLVDVPLVERQQRRAAGVHRQLGDPQVLGGDALGGVADDDRDVGALGRPLGAELRVVVDACPRPSSGAAGRRCRRASAARPSTSSSVSIASRVVPARSETITRSEPRKALTSEDLPTLGRPITATARRPRRPRRGRSRRRSRAARRPGRAGRRCRGRARRRRRAARRARASGTRRRAWSSPGRSTLLATTITGHVAAAQDLGELGVAGAQPGARVDDEQRRASASAIASRAWRLDRPRPARPRRRGRRRRCRSGRSGLRSTRTASALRSRVTPASRVDDGLAAAGQPVDEGALADVGKADDGDCGQSARSLLTSPARAPAPTTRSTTSSTLERRGVELDRVVGRAQGAVRALAVAASRCALGCEHGLECCSPVSAARRRARSLVDGGQEDLERRSPG